MASCTVANVCIILCITVTPASLFFWGTQFGNLFLSFINTFDKHFILIHIYRTVRLLAYCGKYKLFIDCGCLYKFMFLEASKGVKIKQRFFYILKVVGNVLSVNVLYIFYMLFVVWISLWILYIKIDSLFVITCLVKKKICNERPWQLSRILFAMMLCVLYLLCCVYVISESHSCFNKQTDLIYLKNFSI